MATTKQYEQVNECLNQLQLILKRIGITEFTISENKREAKWELTTEIDQPLLDRLSDSLSAIYKQEKLTEHFGKLNSSLRTS
ncbi:MAG: hypothetical protein JSS96_00320 [Bacteroidetes bacterium]|nr:hypothetical protein [Bacteroidota bacterium]